MCFQAGLTPSEFWQLSWLELNAVLEGYKIKAQHEAEKLISLREANVLARTHTAAFYNANRGKGKRAIKDSDILIFSWETEKLSQLKKENPKQWEQEKRKEGIEKAKAFQERWANRKTRKISM